MKRSKITATVTNNDLSTNDPLAEAINRAIFLGSGDRVAIRLCRQFCIGMFECGSELGKINNPLILNGPEARETVRKDASLLVVGDTVSFNVWI